MKATFLLLALVAAPVKGQDAPAVPTTRSVRDGVYSMAQAERGEAVFARVCALCHAKSQFTGPTFVARWNEGSVYELFELVRTTMPFDNPGELSRAGYADVLAYILRLNDHPAGERDLPSDDEPLKTIRIEPPAR